MAVTTLAGHVSRALDFYKKDSIYYVIGHRNEWNKSQDAPDASDDVNDQNPPTPKNTDTIKDIIGYQKVTSKFLVVKDDTGTIQYKNQKWKIVQESDAISNGARWVYITTYIDYNNLPINLSYRQIGVVTGLSVKSGVSPTKLSLLPNEIGNSGLLEVLDNRTPIYRDADQRERLSLIIEF